MRTGKKVAVIGSVPRDFPPPRSSTAPVTPLTVFERADRPGGLLMYGNPEHEAR